jgi:tetratricopeptide (TPR) repeat protein
LLQELFNTEKNLAVVASNQRQFDLSEGHCQRCLAYSRKAPVDEDKIYMIFAALHTYCILRERQGNLSDALNYAEEGYNVVVEAYDPVHPLVQKAAGVSINILIVKGDFYDAERFAKVTYENLRDKKNGMNQEGEEMAMGGYNLARIILLQKGDLIKAEKFAKESLVIRSQLYSSDTIICNNKVADSCTLLANILKAQDNFGDETKGLYERSLAISIKNGELDGAAIDNKNIALFHHELAEKSSTGDVKLTQLHLAKSHYEEAVGILAKMHGLNHPNTVQSKSLLAKVLNKIVCIENLEVDKHLRKEATAHDSS